MTRVVAVLSIFSGMAGIETDDLATAVKGDLLDFEGRGIFRGCPLRMNIPVAIWPGENITFDFVQLAHLGTHYVGNFSFL